ncbi:hypothetical protein [Halobellus sp. GM3]|uniref:hypothetical protein n=1 Tax=Halobellus sp. GM3 TaxID=3458410 RepID=UPI00403E244D
MDTPRSELELPPEVDTLYAAAQDYWGDDRWAIDVKLWTDGTASAYAYRSRGRNDDGHLIQERLFPTDDGIRATRVELQDSEDLGFVDDAIE